MAIKLPEPPDFEGISLPYSLVGGLIGRSAPYAGQAVGALGADLVQEAADAYQRQVQAAARKAQEEAKRAAEAAARQAEQAAQRQAEAAQRAAEEAARLAQEEATRAEQEAQQQLEELRKQQEEIAQQLEQARQQANQEAQQRLEEQQRQVQEQIAQLEQQAQQQAQTAQQQAPAGAGQPQPQSLQGVGITLGPDGQPAAPSRPGLAQSLARQVVGAAGALTGQTAPLSLAEGAQRPSGSALVQSLASPGGEPSAAGVMGAVVGRPSESEAAARAAQQAATGRQPNQPGQAVGQPRSQGLPHSLLPAPVNPQGRPLLRAADFEVAFVDESHPAVKTVAGVVDGKRVREVFVDPDHPDVRTPVERRADGSTRRGLLVQASGAPTAAPEAGLPRSLATSPRPWSAPVGQGPEVTRALGQHAGLPAALIEQEAARQAARTIPATPPTNARPLPGAAPDQSRYGIGMPAAQARPQGQGLPRSLAPGAQAQPLSPLERHIAELEARRIASQSAPDSSRYGIGMPAPAAQPAALGPTYDLDATMRQVQAENPGVPLAELAEHVRAHADQADANGNGLLGQHYRRVAEALRAQHAEDRREGAQRLSAPAAPPSGPTRQVPFPEAPDTIPEDAWGEHIPVVPRLGTVPDRAPTDEGVPGQRIGTTDQRPPVAPPADLDHGGFQRMRTVRAPAGVGSVRPLVAGMSNEAATAPPLAPFHEEPLPADLAAARPAEPAARAALPGQAGRVTLQQAAAAGPPGLEGTVRATRGLAADADLGQMPYHVAHGTAALLRGDERGSWAAPYLENLARMAWYHETGGQQGPPEQAPEGYLRNWIYALRDGDARVPGVAEAQQELQLMGAALRAQREVQPTWVRLSQNDPAQAAGYARYACGPAAIAVLANGLTGQQLRVQDVAAILQRKGLLSQRAGLHTAQSGQLAGAIKELIGADVTVGNFGPRELQQHFSEGGRPIVASNPAATPRVWGEPHIYLITGADARGVSIVDSAGPNLTRLSYQQMGGSIQGWTPAGRRQPAPSAEPRSQAMSQEAQPVAVGERRHPDAATPRWTTEQVDAALADLERSLPEVPDPDPRLPRAERMRQWAPALEEVERRTGLDAGFIAGLMVAENGFGDQPPANKGNYWSVGLTPQDTRAINQGSGQRWGAYPSPKVGLIRWVGNQSYPGNAQAPGWHARTDPAAYASALNQQNYIGHGEHGAADRAAWEQRILAGRDEYLRAVGRR